MTLARAQYERFRQLLSEFAKFAVIGVTGGFITNAVYDLLHLHLGMGPVTSTTIAMVPVSLHDPSLGLDRSLSGLTGAAAMTITPPAGGSPAA